MKQIAGLVDDCIETIQNEKHHNLEQMAIHWLRDALMQSIKAGHEILIPSTPLAGRCFAQQTQVLYIFIIIITF